MWKCFCDILDETLEEKKQSDWYPIIDYKKCMWCFKCFSFCKNWVYQIDQDGKPFVANPQNCVPGCRGCEKVCPVWAITHQA